jgi:hypothetical protein
VRRGLLVALVAALVSFALPSFAAAQSCPPFDGAISFPEIHSPEDPEDYCWEVQLYEGQELRQVSETEAEVFYESGHEAYVIKAMEAHDAIGTTVPTTLVVTDPNLITLTVHHRAGNPAAGGAPFDYPVVQGEGWEGDTREPVMIQGPPDEAELREAALKAKPSPPVEEAPAPTCEVPILQGRTVKAARRALMLAGCELGPIRGHRHRGARIVKQYRPAFKVLPAGTEVGVRLAR